MRHIIVPFAEQNLTGEGRSTSCISEMERSTGALNALITDPECSQRVGKLDSKQGLTALTMLSWAEVFPLFGLIRTDRAWCPCCLEEWRTSGRIIYEPLLWAVQAVKICVQHGCQLETIALSVPRLRAG